MTRQASGRRPDVDALRVLATYLLFLFHAAKVYDVSPFYHVKSTRLSPGLDVFTGFIHLWHMPLFFVLAGWSVWESLGTRGAGRFLLERVRKLLPPLALGMVAFGPVLRWAELRTGQMILVSGERVAARPDVALLDYVPSYFQNPSQLTWSHLWFLAYLFTFTLLYLPLLVLARRAAVARGAERRVHAWLVYLPILPLGLVQVTLRARWPGMQNLVDDWANFAYYSLFFLLGYALAAAPRFAQICHAQWRPAAALALLASGTLLFLRARGGTPAVALHALSAVAGWCMVLALLGAARERSRAGAAAPAWLVESAFPVYVLHQIGVVLAALAVMELPLPTALRLALTVALALTGTLATYGALLRAPLGPFRAALGLPPSRRRSQPARRGVDAQLGGPLARSQLRAAHGLTPCEPFQAASATPGCVPPGGVPCFASSDCSFTRTLDDRSGPCALRYAKKSQSVRICLDRSFQELL